MRRRFTTWDVSSSVLEVLKKLGIASCGLKNIPALSLSPEKFRRPFVLRRTSEMKPLKLRISSPSSSVFKTSLPRTELKLSFPPNAGDFPAESFEQKE